MHHEEHTYIPKGRTKDIHHEPIQKERTTYGQNDIHKELATYTHTEITNERTNTIKETT